MRRPLLNLRFSCRSGPNVGFTSSEVIHFHVLEFWRKFFFPLRFGGISSEAVVCADVLFNCVQELISCRHLSISASLLKWLEPCPH